MKKYLPNAITSIRILLSPILFYCSSFTSAFFTVYVICAVTDLIDGPIARGTGNVSTTGSLLDSIGDFLVYISMMKIVIMRKLVPLSAILWLLTALMGHLVSAVIAKKRFHRFCFSHTIASKAFGVAMFMVPFAIIWTQGAAHIFLVCVIATWSAVEAVIIQTRNNALNPDTPSLRFIEKETCDETHPCEEQ